MKFDCPCCGERLMIVPKDHESFEVPEFEVIPIALELTFQHQFRHKPKPLPHPWPLEEAYKGLMPRRLRRR